MGQTLQKRLKKIFLFTTLFLGLAFQGMYGQTKLSPGDIAVVTANADKNEDGHKTFDFVPLVDLEANTTIKFTDAPYIETNSELDDSEGTLTYTATTAVSAGTVITYSGEEDGTNGFDKVGHFNPSTGGDNLIVFQGDRSNPNYVFGVGWAKGSSVWEYNAESSSNNRSDIPPVLSEEKNSILSLGTTDNYQYDADNGLEGTTKSLLSLIGEESNWNNDDEKAFPPFETDFTLVDPPTVAFTASSRSGEEGNTIEIKVELVEENTTAVDVDLEFLASSSTVSSSDIDGFSSETLSFSASDASGTEKTMNITLADDSEFEGNEKAVFRLINPTEGTVIEPNEFTLTIIDNDAPDIVINEILYDPNGTGGDANGDGNSDDGTGDEFVELVNNSDNDIDISNWTLSDERGIKYTFPSGTVIPSSNAFVVFSAPAEDNNFGGAYLFASGSLGLNNTGDEVTIKDENGNEVTSVSFDGSESDESITRRPDITGNFEGHASADADDNSPFSPGTQADGTSFGAKHAISIRGTEGWRMISSPVQDASFNDFFSDLWMQGVVGSDDNSSNHGGGTLYFWDEEERGFAPPADMEDELISGKGYIVYIFEDDNNNAPGIQGGFPKIINTDKDENSATITVDISATDDGDNGSIDGDEGWNLLGNPFGTDISVTALLNAFNDTPGITVQGNEIQVWDHKSGNYIALEEGDRLAPFQAFFVKLANEANTSVDFVRENLAANTGTEFYKEISNQEKFQVDLRLYEEQYHDTYSLEFSARGTTELDPDDAYKLFSLNPNSISLFSTINNNYLRKNALPIDLESNLEIPISFDANGRSELTLRWDDSIEDIPNEWDLFLIDNDQNREIDLRRNNEYKFTVNSNQQEELQSTFEKKGLLNKAKEAQDSRFVLTVQPAEQYEMAGDLPESVKLKPNYPNPFNPTTTIPFELDEDSDVLLTVWNMIGQKVATLIDGTMEAGIHEETWNASDMPSGMYIARFEVNGTVFTRKMTLIK